MSELWTPLPRAATSFSAVGPGPARVKEISITHTRLLHEGFERCKANAHQYRGQYVLKDSDCSRPMVLWSIQYHGGPHVSRSLANISKPRSTRSMQMHVRRLTIHTQFFPSPLQLQLRCFDPTGMNAGWTWHDSGHQNPYSLSLWLS